MPAPNSGDVFTYIGLSTSWSQADVDQVLAAEKAAQAARCRVPADDAVWPANLKEALLRRCASNLANRSLPLGVQANIAEAAVSTVRVGGLDREVRRLEGPYRKAVVG